MDKMWHIYTMEYYPTIKRNEVLVHATTRMNPEYIMLSERTQSQKTMNCMIPFIRRQIYIHRKKIVVAWGTTANEYKVSFWGSEYVLKLDQNCLKEEKSYNGCTTM